MTSVLLPEGELRVARCDMLDKLIAVGDGDAALLYLYILRHGGTDGSTAARALRLSADRYERAAFTLNNLIAPMEKTKAATDKSAEAPRYTGDELRRARLDDKGHPLIKDGIPQFDAGAGIFTFRAATYQDGQEVASTGRVTPDAAGNHAIMKYDYDFQPIPNTYQGRYYYTENGTTRLEYLPVPILTGIVVAALIGIVEYKLADKLRKVNRAEFFIFLAAMFGVLLFGTIYGVIIGVILSFIAVVIRAVVPPRSLLGCIPGHEGFYNLNRNRNALEIQHVVMYRFSGNLFFANVSTFLQDIENAIKDDTKVVIVDASGIGSIDITAADRLVSFNKILKDKGLRFYITEHVGNVNDQLRKLGAGCLVEEGVTRRTISLALRDAGVDRPYPLAGTLEQTAAHNDFIEDNERLAEIEWAFGEDASEWLDKFAVQMTDDITHMDENNEHIPDNVLAEAESKNTWGRIGLFDEDELLERVEMHLSELTQNNSNAEELEERIEERRLRLEAKIAKLNPDALAHLRQHRREVMLHFKENNPKAYKHMMERRMEHISKLEKENPELAAKMKKLYKLDDIAGDYSSVKER